ncbi:MAG TPA: glycosyltransferase family 2 protein [Spirochaetota bacterium]|nr:glycosyltransferase family 2 protein [Spirochaetota bacterium]
MQNPKISVVTVTFNAGEFIEQTILSVINQTYENIEFIIVDGLSSDNTLEIIKKYREKISVLISEKDFGIYDAMNKGIRIASGDFIYFLNAGDTLYSNETLSMIFKTHTDGDVYYGRTAILNSDNTLRKITQIPNNLNYRSFAYGMPVSHQSLIFKKNICDYYDLSYKFVSDQDFIISSMKKAKKIYNTDLIVSNYRLGGFSDNNFIGCWKDKFEIVKKHFGYPTLALNRFLFIRDYLKRFVRILFFS